MLSRLLCRDKGKEGEGERSLGPGVSQTTLWSNASFGMGRLGGLFNWMSMPGSSRGGPSVSLDSRFSVGAFMARRQERKLSLGKSTLLTVQQRLFILKSWPVLSVEIASLGLSTQAYIFDRDNTAIHFFEFRGKTGQDMIKDKRYRQHAFWLVQAVMAVVENLDNLDDTVAFMFNELGEKHAAIPHFSISYFGLLPEAWSNVWEEGLKGRYTKQTEKAWIKIFKYIVACLAEGYQLADLAPSTPTFAMQTVSMMSMQQSTASFSIGSLGSAGTVDTEWEEGGGGRKRAKLKQMLGSAKDAPPSSNVSPSASGGPTDTKLYTRISNLQPDRSSQAMDATKKVDSVILEGSMKVIPDSLWQKSRKTSYFSRLFSGAGGSKAQDSVSEPIVQGQQPSRVTGAKESSTLGPSGLPDYRV